MKNNRDFSPSKKENKGADQNGLECDDEILDDKLTNRSDIKDKEYFSRPTETTDSFHILAHECRLIKTKKDSDEYPEKFYYIPIKTSQHFLTSVAGTAGINAESD